MLTAMSFLGFLFGVSYLWAAQIVGPAKGQNAQVAQAPTFHEKPSLKSLLAPLHNTSLITQAYKEGLSDQEPVLSSVNSQGTLQKIMQGNEKILQTWTQAARESQAFWRSEIEEDQVLNQLLVLQQLDFLRIRGLAQKKEFSAVRDSYQLWFRFSSDLSFEESSLIGLRLANLLRSLTLDEIERLEKRYFQDWAQDPQWLQWSARLSAPWPVDRVILTEARKIIRGKGMDTAQAMAKALQKNAYQTAEKVLRDAQGQKVPELKLLEPIWREQDIEAMRLEINRIQALHLRLAVDLSKKKWGHSATDQSELVRLGLLAQPLINYKTGKAFTLPEAAARQ